MDRRHLVPIHQQGIRMSGYYWVLVSIRFSGLFYCLVFGLSPEGAPDIFPGRQSADLGLLIADPITLSQFSIFRRYEETHALFYESP